MNRQQLLDELERLPSGSRMRQMVELGHQASQRQDISATIDQMEQGNFYERHLALHSCYGSHDTARIMRALADPSRSIRKSALPLAALCCDDAQVQQVLAATLPKQRVVLLRWLLKHKRQAPIDAFLTTLVGHDERPDDPHLLGLLWFGSAGFVQPLLARLLPTATAVDWRRLARRHPALISHALLDLATLVERMDQRLRWQANAVLVTLSDLDPERALALVRELAQHIPLHQLDLSILARRRPNAVADLLLAADEQTSVNLASVAHHLSTDRLIALLVKRPGVVPLTDQWFRRLPPEQRVTLYRNFERGWRDGDNALPSWLIGRLPRELREGEGARHATLPAFAARPLQQIAYTAYLPWDEARHALDPFIRLLARPAAMVRVSALQRCQQLPISDPEQLLLPHLLASMASRIPDESVSAASAVFATYVGRQAPLTAQAVQRLLPNRRALQTALSQFSSAVRYDHGRLLPTARAVLAVLATDPLAASLRVDLAVNALPGDELAQLIMDMATAHELHADALATAEQTLANGAQQLSEEEWAQLEATLAASADRYVRRLAVTALVMQSHDAHGWTDERQARLRAYRADPATLVASAAQFTFTPMEIGADT